MNLLTLRERIVRETGDYSLVGSSGGSPLFSSDGTNNEEVLNTYINEAIEDLVEEMPELLGETVYTTKIKADHMQLTVPRADHITSVILDGDDRNYKLKHATYNDLLMMSDTTLESLPSGNTTYWAEAPKKFGLLSSPVFLSEFTIAESPSGAYLVCMDKHIYLCMSDGTIYDYSFTGTLLDTNTFTLSGGTVHYHKAGKGVLWFIRKPVAGSHVVEGCGPDGVDQFSFSSDRDDSVDLAVDEDTVYVLFSDGVNDKVLRAYEIDGTQRWETSLTYVPKYVQVMDNRVYVVSSTLSSTDPDRLFVYDRTDGVEEHSFAIPKSGPFVVVNNRIHMQVQDHLVVMDLAGNLISHNAFIDDDALDVYTGIATEDGSYLYLPHVDNGVFEVHVYGLQDTDMSKDTIMVYPPPISEATLTVIGQFMHKWLDITDLYEETDLMRQYWRYIIFRACTLWGNSAEDSRVDKWLMESDKTLRNNHARFRKRQNRSVENRRGGYQIQEF